jgi:hypothetical protein
MNNGGRRRPGPDMTSRREIGRGGVALQHAREPAITDEIQRWRPQEQCVGPAFPARAAILGAPNGCSSGSKVAAG